MRGVAVSTAAGARVGGSGTAPEAASATAAAARAGAWLVAVASAAGLLAGCGGGDADPGPGSLPAGLAFVIDDDGVPARGELWLLPVGDTSDPATASPVRLDATIGTPGDVRQVEWAPDGGRIAALVGQGDAPALVVYGVLPSTAPPTPTTIVDEAADMFGWDPAGRRLLHADGERRLWVSDLTGGTTRLSDADAVSRVGTFGDYRPTWSPDGRGVGFKEKIGDGWTSHVVTLAGLGVTADRTALWRLDRWTPSGAAMLGWTRADAVAEPAPVVLCLATGAALPLSGPPDLEGFARFLSADGRHLLVLLAGEVMVADVDGCAVTERARVSLAGAQVVSMPQWTGDGRHAVWLARAPSGDGRVEVLDVEAPATLRVITAPGVTQVRVHEPPPVGARVLWGEWRGGREHLMVSGDDARGGREVVAGVGGATTKVVWPSPDGQRVAYTTDTFDGEEALEVVDLGSGVRQVIHRGPTSAIAWAPDGRTLAFYADGPGDLFVTRDDGRGFALPRGLGDGRHAWSGSWSP